jgi:hypothetical protein
VLVLDAPEFPWMTWVGGAPEETAKMMPRVRPSAIGTASGAATRTEERRLGALLT